MIKNLTDSILSVCEILNKHSVQYLIVGGTAVALHGYFRPSMNIAGMVSEKPDLDFWYNSTYENYFKLLNALEDLGPDVNEFKAEKSPNPKKSFFRFQFDNFTIDFLPELKASIKFIDAYRRKEVVIVDGAEIMFLCFEDLISDKLTDPRPKDITDVKQLEIKRSRKEN